MTEETVLADSAGALLPGDFTAKPVVGVVTLTDERLVFGEQKLKVAIAGGLGALATELVQGQPKQGSVLVDVPVATIATVTKGRWRLNKNVLVVSLTDGRTVQVTDSFKQIEPGLQKLGKV